MMQKWGSLNRVIFLISLYFIFDDDDNDDDNIKIKKKIINTVIHDIRNILLIRTSKDK